MPSGASQVKNIAAVFVDGTTVEGMDRMEEIKKLVAARFIQAEVEQSASTLAVLKNFR